jgi:hypothetical protein
MSKEKDLRSSSPEAVLTEASRRKKFILAELLPGLRPEDRHAEVDFGPPVGREFPNEEGGRKYAVFYALKDKIIEAVVEDGSIRKKVGTTLRLSATSVSERGNDPDTRSLKRPQETREYKIVAIEVFEGDGRFGGDDGIDRVLEDRDWEEGRAYQNKDFFDWYYAANILGIFSKPRDYFPLNGSIIVELE